MIRIDSPENKLIKLAASLKQRKYRQINGLFLVEGKRSVCEVLQRPDLLHSLLIDESLYGIDFWLEVNSWADAVVVKSGLLRSVCATENPQGVLAIVKMPQWIWKDHVVPSKLTLLLDQVSDPGNMGSILRTSWGLDVGAVLLTKGCVDPFSPKVVRSTMGALLGLPLFTDITAKQLENLKKSAFNFLCTEVNSGTAYYDVSYVKPSLIIFGSESQGVSTEIKACCDQYINIPLKLGVESLNVGAACAIILAEAWRQRLSVPS